MTKLLKIELLFENMNEKLQYITIYAYIEVVLRKNGGKLLLYVVEMHKRFKLTKAHSLTMPEILLYI